MTGAEYTQPSSADEVTGLSRWLIVPFLVLLRGYQKWISPMTPPTCRFAPSCSAYALTALRRHGLLRGTWMAIRRVLRCHPWNPGGVDHVPPRRAKHSPTTHDRPSDSRLESVNPALRNT